MAADLHIHIFEGITEKDLANFFSNSLGSKYFKPRSVGDPPDNVFKKIGDTPNVWIGEVSWLKAGLSDDPSAFIPDTVGQISELVGEDLPILDDDLIGRIVAAFGAPNTTGYSLQQVEEVKAFLETHKGKQVFKVSW